MKHVPASSQACTVNASTKIGGVECSLGEEGAAAIADFVKQGKKLKELNLYMNDIGTGGAYKVTNLASSA